VIFNYHTKESLMKRISLISALVLGGSFLFAPVAKAEQTLDLDFTGVAQANCLFTNISSGLIVALGADLGTIGSNTGTQIASTVAGISPQAAGFTAACNSQTALFVYTPVADAANPTFAIASTKSVLSDTTGTPVKLEAYTSAPGNGLAGSSTRSDGFYPIAATSATTPVNFKVDMNVQSKAGIPVGIYKYTVLVTAVPQ
jgi:hypothetical protein